HDLGFDSGGEPLLAMKLVKGESWNARLKKDFLDYDAPELLSRNLPILIQVAQAVAFAHSKGIIHRDIKRAQVVLGDFGEVLLMDWGLAVATGTDAVPADAAGVRLPSPNTASSPAGTPSMMAPEQTGRSGAKLGPWTDVYLLGGTL